MTTYRRYPEGRLLNGWVRVVIYRRDGGLARLSRLPYVGDLAGLRDATAKTLSFIVASTCID